MRARRLQNLYSEFVRPGDLVFDVGAHVGNHATTFATLGARVIAIEPQPVFARFLKRIYRHSKVIRVLEVAVGPENGKANLHVSSDTPTLSSLEPGWIETISGAPGFEGTRWESEVEVEVLTLDSLIETFGMPAFCKLDIEGGELGALQGLTLPLPAIAWEYLPAVPDLAVGCLERLESLGDYIFNWSRAERALLQPEWVGKGQVLEHLAGLNPQDREGNLFARRI